MYFYKYVVPERVDVLVNGMIRFTQPTALNDPFELRPYFDTLVSDDHLRNVVRGQGVDLTPVLIEVYEKQSAEIKARVSLDTFLAFTRDFYTTASGQEALKGGFSLASQSFRAAAPVAQKTVYEGLAKHVGVLSLSTDCKCAPMWAHYAAGHTGMVIGFDGNHPFFHQRRGPDDEFWYLRQVVYEAPSAGRALLDLESRDVLIRKDPSWSYEQEWRMLAPLQFATHRLEAGSEPTHLFEFPSSCVAEVILGARSSNDLCKALEDLVGSDERYKHLRLKRAGVDIVSLGVTIAPLVH
jgi:Protein of unknown function (DUF2971)